MVKVKPLPVEDSFDGLDEVHNVDYHLHRGTKSSKRVKRKQTQRIKESQGKHNDIVDVLKNLLFGKQSLHSGVPFLCFGLFLSMVFQLMPKVQRYNIALLPALAAAVEYKHFPANSVRPQVLLALMILLSVAVDIFQIVNDRIGITPVLVATIVLIVISKLALLRAFLHNSQGAVRTRKYLKRRFRLFLIPLNEPRRIMRDVRGRMLAIGWFQLIGAFVFFGLFLVQVTYLDYSALYLSPARGDGALPMFLMIKVATLLMVFLGVLYDTDIRLCLWYFGCLGFATDYVRKYISKKRLELGGFPLSFAFSKMRYQVLCFVKLVDVLWGLYGWVIISYPLGGKFYSLDTHLQILYGMVAFSLVMFDIWSVTLFLGVRWLLRRRKIVKELGELSDSDDSEIEEFKLRANLDDARQHQVDKAQLAETRRRLYLLKMKEEQTRFAEGTAVDETGRGSRAAADWVQGMVSWVPRGKSRSIHPDGTDETSVEAAAWEEGAVVRSKQQGNPLMRQLQEHQGFNDVARKFPQGPSVWERLQVEDSPEKDMSAAQIQTITKALSRQPTAASPVVPFAADTAAMVARPQGQGPRKPIPRPAPVASQQDSVYDIDWKDDEEHAGADDEGAVLSPLIGAQKKQQQTLLPRGYSDYQMGYAMTGAKSAPATTGVRNPTSRGTNRANVQHSVELEPSQSIPADQFAEIWEVLTPSSVSKISTVLVPTKVRAPAVQQGSDDEQEMPVRDPAAEKALRAEQQQLLTSLITHMREKRFSVAAAGLHQHHPNHVLKLYCYGTLAAAVPSETSRAKAAERMGFVEIKMFPGAVMTGGAAGSKQSYLMEITARSKDSQQAQIFLQWVDFRSILSFID